MPTFTFHIRTATINSPIRATLPHGAARSRACPTRHLRSGRTSALQTTQTAEKHERQRGDRGIGEQIVGENQPAMPRQTDDGQLFFGDDACR